MKRRCAALMIFMSVWISVWAVMPILPARALISTPRVSTLPPPGGANPHKCACSTCGRGVKCCCSAAHPSRDTGSLMRALCEADRQEVLRGGGSFLCLPAVAPSMAVTLLPCTWERPSDTAMPNRTPSTNVPPPKHL